MGQLQRMSVAEWLGCREPARMLRQLHGGISDRKWRLLACACARAAWPLLPEGGRHVVELAERHADGEGSAEALVRATHAVHAPAAKTARPSGRAVRCAVAAANWCASGDTRYSAQAGADQAAQALAWCAVAALPPHVLARPTWDAALLEAGAAQCDLVRELFNPLWQPVRRARAWLSWGEGTVPRLAREIYDAGRFEEMPVLADALEDAGCDNPVLLRHCRQGGHARGCWALDLILGMG